jgi:hypothetical protein
MPTVAKCLAIASDVNDLPSDGPALVTNSVLGRPLVVENWSEAQSDFRGFEIVR